MRWREEKREKQRELEVVSFSFWTWTGRRVMLAWGWWFIIAEPPRNWPGKGRRRLCTLLATSPHQSSRCWWWCRRGQKRSRHRQLKRGEDDQTDLIIDCYLFVFHVCELIACFFFFGSIFPFGDKTISDFVFAWILFTLLIKQIIKFLIDKDRLVSRCIWLDLPIKLEMSPSTATDILGPCCWLACALFVFHLWPWDRMCSCAG